MMGAGHGSPNMNGKSTCGCERQAELAACASLLVFHMIPAPRQVCRAEGGDVLGRHDGATRILDILRSYLAPEAADAIRQQVARFANYRRSGQSVNGYSAEFGLLRAKAASKMEMEMGPLFCA